LEAVDIIHDAVVIERMHCNRFLVRMRDEYLLTDAVSRLLAKTGNVKPPTHKMWELPLATLMKAMRKVSEAYTYTGYERKRRLVTARHRLLFAVSDFNKVHKAWYEYRNQLEIGAKAVILTMEITITLLSGALGAAASARIAASVPRIFAHTFRAKMLVLTKQAAAKAGISLGVQTAKAIGMKLQAVDDVNYGKIILNTLVSFSSDWVGGALSSTFLSMLTPKLAPSFSSSSGVLEPYKYTPTQELVADFLGDVLGKDILKSAAKAVENSIKGKKVTVDQILDSVIQEMATRNLKDKFKEFLKKAGKI